MTCNLHNLSLQEISERSQRGVRGIISIFLPCNLQIFLLRILLYQIFLCHFQGKNVTLIWLFWRNVWFTILIWFPCLVRWFQTFTTKSLKTEQHVFLVLLASSPEDILGKPNFAASKEFPENRNSPIKNKNSLACCLFWLKTEWIKALESLFSLAVTRQD